MLPLGRLQLRIEQALADAVGGDDQLRRLELVDEQLEQHRRDGRRWRGAAARPRRCKLRVERADQLPQLLRSRPASSGTGG